MITLILATRNPRKAEEIVAILSPRFHYLTLRDFPDAPSVAEDADTFAGNATKKALQLARWLAGIPKARTRPATGSETFVLADDSGLDVDALNGAPGVHSARFAALDNRGAINSSDAANNVKLLKLLEGAPREKRTARFRCVIALAPVPAAALENKSPVCYADEVELQAELFEGVCEGQIAFAPRGQNGFGYDPLFIPAAHDQTFAELSDATKNKISHRAQALSKLRGRLLR